MSSVPNFLYIGSSKSGSTWIFKVLSWHPQIYMYPGKNLGFFSSRYDNGWDWYTENFHPEPHHKIVGDVSHSYLVSEDAAARIHDHLPGVKMMVCLRDPVQRTFSDYLDGIKNGRWTGTFEEELERTPALIKRSGYGTHLSRYLERFDRKQIHIANFDELGSDPAGFAARMFEFLEVDPLSLPPNLQGKVLPAGTPRSRALASLAKTLSAWARRAGLKALRGKVKTSRVVRNVLYRPYDDSTRPAMASETEARLREMMAGEVQLLDRIGGTDFCGSWGYPRSA
jgi:hypothetical protein